MRRPRRSEAVILHQLPEGEHALSDAAHGKMLVINSTGAAIWLLLDGERDLEDVTRNITASVEAEFSTVRRDVGSFVAELKESGFLDESAP